MNIAIIGTGNVGGTLATKWSKKGHEINLGARDTQSFKGKHLLENPYTHVYEIAEAVRRSEVVLLSTPAPSAADTARLLGDTSGKVIIDAMNIIMGKGPEGYQRTTDAILANTNTRDVVKCFNSTGYNNMTDPKYGNEVLDMFVAGDSKTGTAMAIQLAKDAGFENCYSIGGNDKFDLLEQFAMFWINLALFQGHGREIGFKLLKR